MGIHPINWEKISKSDILAEKGNCKRSEKKNVSDLAPINFINIYILELRCSTICAQLCWSGKLLSVCMS